MGLMEDIQAQVSKLDEGQLRERLAQIEKNKAERKEAQKVKLQNLSPEQKVARNEKHKEYRLANAEKFKAARTAYNQKPEVVERRKAYMKKRNETAKAILARARELGITAGSTTT